MGSLGEVCNTPARELRKRARENIMWHHFSPRSLDKEPFAEGLAKLEERGKVLVNANDNRIPELFTSWRNDVLPIITPIATGTIAAYTKRRKKLTSTIEWLDEETEERWIFQVPEQYRNKSDILLTVDHPFWVLETDGKNRVIHCEPTKVTMLRRPTSTGTYHASFDDPLLCVQGKASIEETNSYLKGIGYNKLPYWVKLVYVEMAQERVGPVVLGRNPNHRDFFHINLAWQPSLHCIILFDQSQTIRTELVELAPSHILKARRNIGEMVICTITLTSSHSPPSGWNKRVVKVPAGARLAELRGTKKIKFSCMAGHCRYCKVVVTDGIENLEPPNALERDRLKNYPGIEIYGHKFDPNERLFCLARIKKGNVEGSDYF